MKTQVEGVATSALKRLVDERGVLMRMVRADSPLFKGFGEVYFSVVNPGVVKAWKRHERMTQLFCVPRGNIRLVVFDGRDGSPSKGKLDVLEVGESNYVLVRIPPGLWYGFRCLGKEPAMVANCADIMHDPAEMENAPLDDPRVPYDWKKNG